jgi:hypothetical protein
MASDATVRHEMDSSANADHHRSYQDATHFEFKGVEVHGGLTVVSREYASLERYVLMGILELANRRSLADPKVSEFVGPYYLALPRISETLLTYN